MDKRSQMVLRAMEGEHQSGQHGIIRAVCPFCLLQGHYTKKKKLDYSPATGKWSCWRCKTWGRLTPQDSLSAAFKTPSRPSNGPSPIDPPEGFMEIGEWPSETTMAAHRYATKRGITRSAIAGTRMGITLRRANRDEGEQDFRGRLIVPILDPHDQSTWLGYVGRDYSGKSSLPYLYSRGMSRAKVLYREEVLWKETDVPALMVEGTLDAAFLYPDGVAVLGTWGTEQIEKLRAARRPVVWVLDGDAWRKGEAAAMAMEVMGIRGGHVHLPPTMDPDNMDRGWLYEEARRSIR